MATALALYRIPSPIKTEGFAAAMGKNPNEASPQFMTDDLLRSGLVPEDTYSQPLFQLREGVMAGYFIPYFDLDGKFLLSPEGYSRMYRVRQRVAPGFEDKTGKYDQPGRANVGDLCHIPYIHPKVWTLKTDVLLICEGEKKAVAAMKYLGHPAVGIAGCHNWKAHGRNDVVHDWISEVINRLQPKKVLLVPDGDIRRYDIAQSYGTFASILRRAGVDVAIPMLPSVDDKIDDLLIQWGSESVERFNALTLREDFVENPRSLIREYELAVRETKGGLTPKDLEANYLILLRRHPAFRNIWYNLDKSCVMVDNKQMDPEIGMMNILNYFQYSLGFDASLKKITDTAMAVAKERGVSPFLEKLDKTAWDGVPRLETMFVDYCGSPATPVVLETGRKWLVASVNRMLDPGCIVDYMVVAQGAQGIGKSSFPSIVWGRDYVVSFMGHYDSKDTGMLLHGGLLVNFEEMTVMHKKDLASLKAMITNRIDAFREPYGRAVVQRPRRNVLYGSVNEARFLPSDSTGQRRWAVIPFRQVEFKKLEADRDQLWAEAWHKRKDVSRWGEIDSASDDSRLYVEENEVYNQMMDQLENMEKVPTIVYRGKTCWSFKIWELMALMGIKEGSSNSWATKNLKEAMRAGGWIHVEQSRAEGERLKNVWLYPV